MPDALTAGAVIIDALTDNLPDALHVKGIMSETNLGETTVRTALKGLIAEGLIAGKKIGSPPMMHFSLVEAPVPPTPEQPALPEPPSGKKAVKPKVKKSPKQGNQSGARREAAKQRDEAVLQYLTEHPTGFHRRDLSVAMDVDYDLLYISLWRLEHDGLITKVRDGSRSPVWRIKLNDGPAS